MQTFDPASYVNGMSSASFFLASLICGLELCFDIFRIGKTGDKKLSRIVGIIFLFMSLSTVCYICYEMLSSNRLLLLAGNTIDFLLFMGGAIVAYVLCSNNRPSFRILVFLSSPFVIIAGLNLFVPVIREYLLDTAILVLILQYCFFWASLRHHEATLDDLYSNPDSHSTAWIRGITVLFIGWWILRTIFNTPCISFWYDVAMYIYMTAFVLFAFSRVINYNEPVCPETRNQIEKMDWSELETASEISTPLKAELLELLNEQKIYLNPDLTVVDVVKKLGTNTKYFSAMLHNDMHTTFCRLINEYRVARAIELLQSTDDKMEHIGLSCGFNSRQSFYRTFFKMTGKTPSEFRKP